MNFGYSMAKQSKYIKALKELQSEHKEIMREIVNNTLQEQETLVSKVMEDEVDDEPTLGEKVADKVAKFGGSWVFIINFFLFIVVWMIYNCVTMGREQFDPYPFILLNLVLSCLAAVQAPIILMSQNRQESRDRRRAQNDYMVNLKAELRNRAVDKKVDLLINELFSELLEIQATQINKLEHLEDVVIKVHSTTKALGEAKDLKNKKMI